MPSFALLSLLVTCVSSQPPAASPSPAGVEGYYRQPAIHGDVIVFVSEGDLWRVGVGGGLAMRLTSHAGDESHPAISPDGSSVAFLAQYEGATEVYTMPISGGLPARRTWGAARPNFVGWTPDGKILYSTREFSTLPASQLAVIDAASGAVRRIALAEADQGSYAEDGATLYFTRLPFQGSNTKRYKGGFVQQLWKFTEGGGEASALTADYAGTSKDPMTWQGRVYFASDRDGVMNIWSVTADGKDARQHTHQREFDVASPDLRAGRVVYQCGADVRVVDVTTGADAAIPITLASDLDQMRENWVKEPAKYISAASISADGDRLALTARGHVFVAPAKQGRLVEVTRSDGVRYRAARFMPDGKSLVALSDRSGEVEFWTLAANGVGEAAQITSDSSILRWEGVPSPDGKLLAHHDKNQRLYVTDIAAKTTALIAENPVDQYAGLAWSGDSAWLAFVEPAENQASVVKLYSVVGKQVTTVTSDRFDSFSPAFSPDGTWLYLLSDRNIHSVVASPWGPMAPQPFFDKKTKVYHVALKAGARSPWAPRDELMPKDDKDKDKDKKEETKKEEKKDDAKPADEAKKEGEPAKDEKSEKSENGKKKEKKPAEVVIDLEGLAARLQEVAIKPGNYANLSVNDKALFFESREAGPEAKPSLLGVAVTNDKPEVKTVQAEIRSYELSQDGKKLLLRKEDNFWIVDASAAPAELEKHAVDLSALALAVTPAEEWREMYTDAWRLLRDYFYARNMHGVDWNAMREKYAPLLARVRCRGELNDVLAQLTGELSTLHHFVRGGDLRQGRDQVGVASLGAVLTRDEAAGGYRVEHIYEFDPDEPTQVPPLARPGVDVKEGDVITRINGQDVLASPGPAAVLRALAGRQVLLRVIPKGKAKDDARDAVAVAVSAGDDSNLRYNEWEVSRRRLVEDWGEKQIGYVHLRAMGTGNIAEWAKGFFPVYTRQGLIIDVRRNNGGNIDSWVLGQLLRKAWMFWNQHTGRAPSWNMQYAFRGHVAVLCDAMTASDGEAFTEGFKRLGLGKVFGTRTWGGEVWLSSSNTLVDEGLASAGEYGVFGPGPDGQMMWLVEGHGVEPDVVVDNPPHATFLGEDAQLKAAVEYLRGQIREKPAAMPPEPALPEKALRPR